MEFTFNKMKLEDAHQIASWHYEAPYDFYDWDRDPDDLAELLNPQSWQESYYSVFNELKAIFDTTDTSVIFVISVRFKYAPNMYHYPAYNKQAQLLNNIQL